MTLPTGENSISASQIRDEFGPTTESGEKVALGDYRVSQTFGELSNLPLDTGIPQSGAISFDDFHGKKLNIIVDYYSSKYADYTRENEGEAMNIRDRFTGGTDVNVVGGFMKEMNPKMDSEPYFGLDYKIFRNRKFKIFYNQSEMMKTIGIKTPILEFSRKRD